MAWIFRNLKKSAKSKFRSMMQRQAKSEMKLARPKKRRSAKQKAATRKLIAFNKRRRRRR